MERSWAQNPEGTGVFWTSFPLTGILSKSKELLQGIWDSDTCMLRHKCRLPQLSSGPQRVLGPRPGVPPTPFAPPSLTSFCSFSMVLSRCHRSFSISFFSLLNCSFCSVSSLSFSDNCFCSWVARLRFLCRRQGRDSAVTLLPGQPQERGAEGMLQPYHRAIDLPCQ